MTGRITSSVFLLIGSFLVAIGCAELILKLVEPEVDGYYVYEPNSIYKFHVQPGVMTGISGASNIIINSDGIRGDDIGPDHSYRILAVGGSTTECLYLDHEETWPYLVQSLLNNHPAYPERVWVGNVGRSGLTSREHIIQLRYLLAQYEDLDMVLLLVGANDILRRLATDTRYNPDRMLQPGVENELLPRSFRVYPVNSQETGLESFAIGRLVKKALYPVTFEGENVVQDRAGVNYGKWRLYRRQAKDIRDKLPELGPALDEYERNIRELIQIARSHEVRLVLMTQPSIYREDLSASEKRLLWMGGIGAYNSEPGHSYYSVRAMSEMFSLYNKKILDICRSESVECIDLEAKLPKDTSVFYDDMHFNESGAAAVAEQVADYLVNKQPQND